MHGKLFLLNFKEAIILPFISYKCLKFLFILHSFYITCRIPYKKQSDQYQFGDICELAR